MGQGDVPPSRGGWFRRRRANRHLEHLAEKAAPEVSPGAAKGHVRVIEDQPAVGERESGQEVEAPAESSAEAGPHGFHVKPVPIDQPLREP